MTMKILVFSIVIMNGAIVLFMTAMLVQQRTIYKMYKLLAEQYVRLLNPFIKIDGAAWNDALQQEEKRRRDG